ncbi:MAG: HD domain-containing protein [Deltaproteobacteria bacterium]|nr:HD domain-containing protein [Deltaproteobacteria bacterium]
MKDNTPKTSFLRSKVARRIFLQFVLCALVPIAILGIISFEQVTKQLHEQGRVRLLHFSKSMGMSVFERLTFLENELQNLSLILHGDPETLSASISRDYQKRLKQQFKGIVYFRDSGKGFFLLGTMRKQDTFSGPEKQHLNAGKPLIISQRGPQGRLHIYLARYLVPQTPTSGIIMGEANIKYLLGLSEYDTLPHKTELCVLDQRQNVLYSTVPIPAPSYQKKVADASSGYFHWNGGRDRYLASFWSIPLKYYFLQSTWTIIMSQPEKYIFSPVAYFHNTFPLVILLSFFVVIFISLVQIRRTMLPLQELKRGAQLIGMKQFDERISIESKDEFEDLAQTFNGMAKQLGRQFTTMAAAAEIDRAILSSLKTEEIARIALTRMSALFHCNTAGLILLDRNTLNPPTAYVLGQNKNEVRLADNVEVTPDEIKRLLEKPDFTMVRQGETIPQFLDPLATNQSCSFTVFPIFIKEDFAGIIVLGPSDPFEQEEDNLSRARLLANQVAVSLSNARLLEELSALNWGTLKALARAVDAKSPWTAGHSERVTKTALRIGRALHLSPEELKDLHRGGLLHDIGKIGVPAHILDKPAKLTPEEWRIIREHPRMGAKIIEPIGPYKRIIPMILQHHERFDGKGYPDRLAGNAISLGARILAVADAYDAMVSDRPYRKALTREEAIQIIRQEAGRQLDPDAAAAFLDLLDDRTSFERHATQDLIPLKYPHSARFRSA